MAREIRLEDEGGRPEALVELGARDRPGAVFDQEVEELERLRRQVDLIGVTKEPPRARVERERPEPVGHG